MPTSFRRNSRLIGRLGDEGAAFLKHALDSFARLMPHCVADRWREVDPTRTTSTWRNEKRREVVVTIGIRDAAGVEVGAVHSTVKRRNIPRPSVKSWKTMDPREHQLCKLIAERITRILRVDAPEDSAESLRAIRRRFDENVVAEFIATRHGLRLDVAELLDSMHELAGQTYENSPIAFGCLLDPAREGTTGPSTFPTELLGSKKYKALSDGFRTAYYVATTGHVLDFWSLESQARARLGDRHFFPLWCRELAASSRNGRCGLALTAHGDILVFDEGSLVLTYRCGRWQIWSHGALWYLLRDLIRGRKVPLQTSARLAKAIYRSALDASFRRKGALFVVLEDSRNVAKIVREEDRMGGRHRETIDADFDLLLQDRTLQSLDRDVIVELASLDGAIVVRRNGGLLGYGAVLKPHGRTSLKGSEGSRTKAAIGASRLGTAVKVSSDGQITIYAHGKEYLQLAASSS